MKIYFIRNTHDEYGEYRGDEYFGRKSLTRELQKRGDIPQKEWKSMIAYNEWYDKNELPFGAHTWMGSGEKYKMTFDEIYKETINLYKAGAHEGCTEMPNDEKHTIQGFLKALAFMIENKLVIVQIDP